jgi:hypothetical protein
MNRSPPLDLSERAVDHRSPASAGVETLAVGYIRRGP